jgi:hypothetical protein
VNGGAGCDSLATAFTALARLRLQSGSSAALRSSSGRAALQIQSYGYLRSKI